MGSTPSETRSITTNPLTFETRDDGYRWWEDSKLADALEAEISELQRDLRHLEGRGRERQLERIADAEERLSHMCC